MNINNNLEYVKDFFAKIPGSYIGNLAGRTVTYLNNPFFIAAVGYTLILLAARFFKCPNHEESQSVNEIEKEASLIKSHIKNIMQMEDDEDSIPSLENKQIINPKVNTLVKNLPSSAKIPSEAYITTGFYKGNRYTVKCLNLTSFEDLRFNEFGSLQINNWRHERTAEWFKIGKHIPLKDHRFVAYQLNYISEFIFVESEDQNIKFLIRNFAKDKFIFNGNLLKSNPNFINEQNEKSSLINKLFINKLDENSTFKVLPDDIIRYIASILYLV